MQFLKRNQIPPVDSKRNKIVFTLDSTFFGVGAYFISVNTVLTALAAQLTNDKALIGLVPLAWQVSFLLPQLFAARLIQGKTRTRSYMVLPLIIGRPPFIILGLLLLFGVNMAPQVLFWLLLFSVMAFMVSDSFATAAWFDMLARNFSPRIKGRVITWGGVLGSVGGIAAGIIVGEILGDTNIPFPLNYGIVITVANVLFFLSFSMILLNREVPGNPKAHEEKRDVSYLKHIKDLIATDPRLRKAILVRVLANVEQMAAAFYVVYARESLKLPESAIGIFTVAVVAGGILGTTIFGWVYNRFGALRVINSASTLQFLAPLMAFLVSFIAVPGTFWAYIAYGVMFVVMMINGALGRSNILGYMSYVQESASEANRSAYLGALNTIAGIIALMPVVGGVIIDALTGAGWGFMAYTVVFGLCTLVSGLGTWRGFHLPKLTNRDTRL